MSRTPTARWGFSRPGSLAPGPGISGRPLAYHLAMTARPPVLGALDPAAPPPFGRDSVVRAVVAEPVTALLVQRALVMDVAHPEVAGAVADHSDFQRRPLTRAWATVDAALRLVFGDEQVARDAARQIYAVHDHIEGSLGGSKAARPRGEGGTRHYTAHDATLLTWVWATLVDTAETAYTRWVRPFRPPEAQVFYDEMRSFGQFFGIPDQLLPPDREAFSSYLDDMLGGELLGASGASRSLARQVLWFEHRVVPSPLVRVERVLALATLDPRVLERLGIRPDTADVDLGRRVDAWLSAHYRRFPRPPRVLPALYVLLRGPSVGLAGRARTTLSRARAIVGA
jgi:uncharacterized protein (DUF2236 family)